MFVAHRPLAVWAVHRRLLSTVVASKSSAGATTESACAPSAQLAAALNPTAPAPRKNLVGMTREELATEVTALGLESYRAKQLWAAIYNQGVRNFDQITNMSKKIRATLHERYRLDYGKLETDLKSKDGTRKFLINFGKPNEAIETVFIPAEHRGTLCVSSQIGCSLSCSFCHTGTQKLLRNLTASEIVGQFMTARSLLQPDLSTNRAISNIVFMGQGEPLLNYRNVSKALHILNDGDGLALSKQRITVSTSGIVPLIVRLGTDHDVNLAISLHAVTNELRDELVPINKTYPLEALLEACRAYPSVKPARPITFEYVMLKGVNDSTADARRMVRLLKGIPSFVNLIPFNPWFGTKYETSTEDAIDAFGEVLAASNLHGAVRWPRGDDILAACGQLRTGHERKRVAMDRGDVLAAPA